MRTMGGSESDHVPSQTGVGEMIEGVGGSDGGELQTDRLWPVELSAISSIIVPFSFLQ